MVADPTTFIPLTTLFSAKNERRRGHLHDTPTNSHYFVAIHAITIKLGGKFTLEHHRLQSLDAMGSG